MSFAEHDGGSDPAWTVAFDGFDPEDEGRREAVCALGNGLYFARAAAPLTWLSAEEL